MIRKSILLLFAFLLATVEAELTEDEIIAREQEWAKKTVRYYQQGFKLEHPLNWVEHDEGLFEMPRHKPTVLRARQLRGRKNP